MGCNGGRISSRWLSNSVAEILTASSPLQFTVGAECKNKSLSTKQQFISLGALIMCLIDVPEELMGPSFLNYYHCAHGPWWFRAGQPWTWPATALVCRSLTWTTRMEFFPWLGCFGSAGGAQGFERHARPEYLGMYCNLPPGDSRLRPYHHTCARSVIAALLYTQTRKEHLYVYFHNSLQLYRGLPGSVCEWRPKKNSYFFLYELLIILKLRFLWELTIPGMCPTFHSPDMKISVFDCCCGCFFFSPTVHCGVCLSMTVCPNRGALSLAWSLSCYLNHVLFPPRHQRFSGVLTS